MNNNNSVSRYQLAIDNGYTDDDIINHLVTKDPSLKDKVKKAHENNYSYKEIAEYLSDTYKAKSDSANEDSSQAAEREYYAKNAERLQKEDLEASPFDEALSPPTSLEQLQLQKQGEKRGLQSLAHGATFGLTKNATGELPEEEQFLSPITNIGEFAGEQLPLMGLFKLFRLPGQLAKNAPLAKRILNPVLNVLKGAGVGMTESGIKDAFQGKIPDAEKMLENGLIWGALEGALNLGGGVAKGIGTLFKRNIEKGFSANNIVENLGHEFNRKGIRPGDTETVAQEALEFLSKEAEQNPPNKAFDNLKNKKVDPVKFEEREIAIPEEPSVPEVRAPEEPVNGPVPESRLNEFEPRAEDNIALGEDVKESIQEGVESIQKEYNAAYGLFDESTAGINVNANEIVRDLWDRAEKVHGGARAQPRGQEALTREFYQVMEDLGAIFQRNERGEIEGLLGSNPIPLSSMVRAGRTTGKLGAWGVGNNVRKNMNAVNGQIKQTIRNEAQAVPGAEEVFNEAEELYKTYIDLYENPTIKPFREKTSKPEKIASFINSPTDLSRVRDSVSPDVYRKVEREFLEKLNKLKLPQAIETLRQASRNLSDDARQLANEIILNKTPSTKLGPRQRSEKTENWVLNQFAKPGKPNGVIRHWETPAGRKEIRGALKNNPNGEEIIKYLQEEKFWKNSEKFINSNGNLDYNAFGKWLKNPENRTAIREISGEEGLKFFDYLVSNHQRIKARGKALETLGNQKLAKYPVPADTKRGKEIIDKFANKVSKEKYPFITKVEDLWENLSEENKAVVGLLSAFKIGVYKTLFALKGRKAVFALAKNPRLRQAARDLFNGKTQNPYALYSLMDQLQEE